MFICVIIGVFASVIASLLTMFISNKLGDLPLLYIKALRRIGASKNNWKVT